MGQCIAFVAIGLFVRFYLFSTSQRKASGPIPSTSRQPLEHPLLKNPSQPESLDWVNVLLAQIINEYRRDARRDGKLTNFLNESFNGPKKPDWLDDIKLTELSVGEDYPIFSNCRVVSTDEEGLLAAEMDVDLSDTITLGIETRVKLFKSFVMPVSLVVSVVRFSARLVISVRNNGKVRLSVRPEFALEVAVKSLLGSRSMLNDMPKMGTLVESRLRRLVSEKVVMPNYREFL